MTQKSKIFFDITLSYSLNGANPSGIPRVQRKLSQYFNQHGPEEIRFCRLEKETGRFLSVSKNDSERLARNFTLHTDEEVREVRFEADDLLIISEAVWSNEHNRHILQVKRQKGVRLVYLFYDLIPVLFPQNLPKIESCHAFERYVIDMVKNAHRIICISESAREDLIKFARSLNLKPSSHLFSVFTLGSDIVDNFPLSPSTRLLEFEDQPYVLTVGTIEPRKNHDLLYNIWHRLTKKRGTLPLLVFAGGCGWGNVNYLINKIMGDPVVANKIKIVDYADDNDLEWLYRNCLFTLFPSIYEGWGLPVSESLSYGKYCLASSASSIPEAGQGLIKHLDPMDFVSWYNEIERLIDDPPGVKKLEEIISREYRPVTWRNCGERLLEVVLPLAETA